MAGRAVTGQCRLCVHSVTFSPPRERSDSRTRRCSIDAMQLCVDQDRLRADFDALARFGATPDGGIQRTTFSEAHLAARAWFLDRARDAGLLTSIDAAANHSAILPSGTPGAKTLLLGSHLDSVRQAGRYDGALGVLCALEVVRAVKDAGLRLPSRSRRSTSPTRRERWSARSGAGRSQVSSQPRCSRHLVEGVTFSSTSSRGWD